MCGTSNFMAICRDRTFHTYRPGWAEPDNLKGRDAGDLAVNDTPCELAYDRDRLNGAERDRELGQRHT